MHLLDFMSSDAMAVDTLYNDIELDSLDVTDQMVQAIANVVVVPSSASNGNVVVDCVQDDKQVIKTHNYMAEHAPAGLPLVCAMESLCSNEPMYRLFEPENYLVFTHRAKKVDALREKLFSVFRRIAKLKSPMIYTGRELPQRDATATDLELGLSVAAASSVPNGKSEPVELDVDKGKRAQHMISLLEAESFQYHEELNVLVQEHSSHVESFERLRSMPVPSRETWSKTFGRQLSTGPLDATDYAPLQYADDLRTTTRSQALFGHEFLMNSNNIFAWLVRWLCTTHSGDSSYTHLNTRRTVIVWNSIVILGFVLVLILPAVFSLVLELSALQSLGVVTVGGSVVVLTGVKRALALEALFYTFCAYMAVMMTIVFGLGNGNYTVILQSINKAG